jgi:hypothetical protein
MGQASPGWFYELASAPVHGAHFETLLTITREQVDAESLERPALVRYQDGTWQLWASCHALIDPAETDRTRHGGGGLRYLDVLALPGGRHRLYYELTRCDGAHELRTELR